MSKGLYIGSTRSYSGKNMLSVGIGLRLQKEGVNLGYMKPVGVMPVDETRGDEDALFVQDVLNLQQPAGLVTPVLVTQDFRMRAFAGHIGDYMPEVASAYEKLCQNRDLTLVCGTGHTLSGKYCGLDGIRTVRELKLKAVIIDRLQHEVNYDELMNIKEQLGDNMIGVVLNDIPASFMAEIDSVIRPFLERNAIPVLGVIPRDPLMGSIRAHELADGLGGRLVAAQGRADGMVENFLIGTMQVENFITYFRRNPHAAVIVGGDRADVQLVAIEGNCPCLVLTGNLYPNDIILSRADTLNVPIVMVRQDTYTVAKKMEGLLTRHKMRDVMKIRQGAQLISNNLDFAAIREALGV
ncbi:MAG: phosphotransacetylase family protein [Desulfovibrionaceae bacterium]|nr:phosphotransacetylase family protein [Desulfovibrionaceae bacterium]